MCSSDLLIRPIEVFREIARVLRPDAPFVCTFSNRCFPTKAIRGWLGTDDRTHVAIVGEYFLRSQAFGDVHAELRTPRDGAGDPLFAVWANRRSAGGAER